MRYASIFVLVAVALLSSGEGVSQARQQDPRGHSETAVRLDDHFTRREAEGFSGVVLLVIDGETVLEKAYGFRDHASLARMRSTDVFDIGSIVKPITRAAILKLEAQGKLRTTDAIGWFFPDAPADKRGITVDQVLRHRGGFPDTLGGDYDLIDREGFRRDLLASPLVARPGEAFNYSNAGYTLLAILIERVAGEPYEEWVRREILMPSGADGVGYRIPDWPMDTLAVGLRQDGTRFGTPLDQRWYGDGPSWNLRGNGGMLANARAIHDLFIALEQDDGVLGREARLAMFPPPTPFRWTIPFVPGRKRCLQRRFHPHRGE